MSTRACINMYALVVLHFVFNEYFTKSVLKLHVPEVIIRHVDHELFYQRRDFFKTLYSNNLNEKKDIMWLNHVCLMSLV